VYIIFELGQFSFVLKHKVLSMWTPTNIDKTKNTMPLQLMAKALSR
jgi:hypothetical protein